MGFNSKLGESKLAELKLGDVFSSDSLSQSQTASISLLEFIAETLANSGQNVPSLGEILEQLSNQGLSTLSAIEKIVNQLGITGTSSQQIAELAAYIDSQTSTGTSSFIIDEIIRVGKPIPTYLTIITELRQPIFVNIEDTVEVVRDNVLVVGTTV